MYFIYTTYMHLYETYEYIKRGITYKQPSLLASQLIVITATCSAIFYVLLTVLLDIIM